MGYDRVDCSMRLRFHLGKPGMETERGENSNGEMLRMLRAGIHAGDGVCVESEQPFSSGMTCRAF